VETSVTVTVAVVVPAVVGVPETTPAAGSIVNPAGSPVADHVNGVAPPVAVTVPL
jgi:hypothetical protein